MPTGRKGTIAIGFFSLLLFVFACLICLKYGLLGIFNDADIVFYSGWLVANGKLPFLDYFVTYAHVQALIQGAIFKLFGVSWMAYVAHAALFNGVYAMLVLVYVRRTGLAWWAAFLYAFASALTYYTPMGYPQPDKHSLLFLLAAMVVQQGLTRASGARSFVWRYALIGLLLTLAVMSKINPAYAFPLVLLPVFLTHPPKMMAWAVAGGALSLAAMVLGLGLVGLVHPGFIRDFVYYAVTLPLNLGASRAGQGSIKLLKVATNAHFATINLVLALAFGLILTLGRELLASRSAHKIKPALVPLATAIGLIVVTLLHFWTIHQQWSGHVALIVLALAHLHLALERIPDFRAARMAGFAVTMAIAGFLLIDLSEYHHIVIKTRAAAYGPELEQGLTQARGATGLADLKDIQYIPPKSAHDFLKNFRETRETLDHIPGNVYLAGLSPWFYAFAHKAPVLPAIYVLPGHSTPPLDSPEEERLAQRLQENLATAKVRYIVVPIEYLDQTTSLIASAGLLCGTKTGETIVTFELCRLPTPQDSAFVRDLLRLDEN